MTVQAHAVIEGDKSNPLVVQADGSPFPTDHLGRPILQTLKPQVVIEQRRRRPFQRPAKLRPAFPRNTAVPEVQTTETSEEQTSHGVEKTTLNLVEAAQTNLKTSQATESVTHAAPVATETDKSQTLAPNTVEAIIDEIEQQETTTEAVRAFTSFSQTADNVQSSSGSPRAHTTDAITTGSSEESTTQVPEYDPTALPTIGTTPWHWVHVDGHWVRQGIVAKTERKTVKPPEWVFINGHWVRQQYYVDESSKSEIQIFEERHKAELLDPALAQVKLAEEAPTKIAVEEEQLFVVDKDEELNVTEAGSGEEVEKEEVETVVVTLPQSTQKVTTVPVPVQESSATTAATDDEKQTTSRQESTRIQASTSLADETDTIIASTSVQQEVASQQAVTGAEILATDPPVVTEANIVENFEEQNVYVSEPSFLEEGTVRFFVEEGRLQDPVEEVSEVSQNIPVEVLSTELLTTTSPQRIVDSDSPKVMDLQGLSTDIISELNFGQVEVESQIVMVHDSKEKEGGRSFIDWCPR